MISKYTIISAASMKPLMGDKNISKKPGMTLVWSALLPCTM
jgi:hypothetical protein